MRKQRIEFGLDNVHDTLSTMSFIDQPTNKRAGLAA
jgi:hypothetical protein